MITPPTVLNIADVSLFDVDQKERKTSFFACFPGFRNLLLVNTF